MRQNRPAISGQNSLALTVKFRSHSSQIPPIIFYFIIFAGKWEVSSGLPLHIPVPALGVRLRLSAAGHVKGVAHLWLKNG